VGPKANLDVLDEENSLPPTTIQVPDHPAHGLVTIPTTQSRLLAIH